MEEEEGIASTLPVPYYAVIFTSLLRPTPTHLSIERTQLTVLNQSTSNPHHPSQEERPTQNTHNQHTSNPLTHHPHTHTHQIPDHHHDYHTMAAAMVALARKQEGFLGVESARGESGLGVTVSYWRTSEAIKKWKENFEHLIAQKRGKEEWYARYRVRVCYVGREYGFEGFPINANAKL